METTVIVGGQKSLLDRILNEIGEPGVVAYTTMLAKVRAKLDKVMEGLEIDDEDTIAKNKLSRMFSKFTIGIWGYLEAKKVKLVNGENHFQFAQRVARERIIEDSKENPIYYTTNFTGRKNKKYQDRLFSAIIEDLELQLGGK